MLLLVMALPAAAQDPLLKDGFAALKAGKNTVAVKRLTDALGTEASRQEDKFSTFLSQSGATAGT